MKKWYMAGAGLLALICLLCLALFLLPMEGRSSETEKKVQETLEASAKGLPGGTQPEETGEYSSPVDFESLRQVNPDIYAWIYIPDTTINYPVLQHASEDDYYLRRNSFGDYDRAGSIYSQVSYNSTDFNDPVTVLYGHNMSSGTMFHPLQEIYSSAEGMEEYPNILIYLPDEERRYTVFAAVPYSTYHLLYNLDFSDAHIYEAFLETVGNVRAMEAHFNSSIAVTPSDRMLILSTCLNHNPNKRYLVLAKEETR